MTRVLVIDNYDSFVYTLNGYVRQLGADTTVIRNDDLTEAQLATALTDYEGLLISPGPGAPAEAGVSIAAVRLAFSTGMPLLGVCLGHQAIAEAFGATVASAPELMHGKTSQVRHDAVPFFDEVPEVFTATRYHSLAVVDGTLPSELVVTARTSGGVIMALQHESSPIFGVQFHPESVLTEGGYNMIGNWLDVVGVAGARQASRALHPLLHGASTEAAPL